MNISIAIVDDNQNFAQMLIHEIEVWASEKGHSVRIKYMTSPEVFLAELSDNNTWNAILLDVSMPEMNGIEVAKKIRKQNTIIPIVFISGFMQYCTEGYEVNALRYLDKNAVNFREKLNECMCYVMKIIEANDDSALLLQTKNTSMQIPYKETMYFEAMNHNIEIHTVSTTFTVRRTLQSIKEELPDRFIFSTRSYCVNLQHVIAVMQNYIVLTDKSTLPLSRQYRDEVMQAFLMLH